MTRSNIIYASVDNAVLIQTIDLKFWIPYRKTQFHQFSHQLLEDFILKFTGQIALFSISI